MNNKDFWNEISSIIDEGFTDKGLTKLEHYAELFINQRLVYKRFSSFEQHGCTTGGGAHVIATLLAGANFAADSGISKPLTVKEERQRAKEQETVIENWAKKVNCWYDDADIKFAELFGGQIAEGGEAHVFLHGLKFLKTIGLDYYLQPVLALDRISLHNAFFPETYLSDLHDENVIRSKGGNIFVIDCDIRINTPDLRCGGIRKLTTEVEFM